MDEKVYDYRVVQCIRVVDGDTYDITLEKRIDFGFRLIETKQWSTRFRLLGADTWETNEAGGAAATRAAEAWINMAIYADVLRGETFKTDNFGRWLIDLYRTDTKEHLSEFLIQGGHAVRYLK